MGITDLGNRFWHGVGESASESASGAAVGVGRGAFENGTIVGKKFSSFDDVFRFGFWDVHLVAPIVFRGAANVTTGDVMG